VKNVPKKSLALLVLVLGAMCLPAASIFAWQRMQTSSEDAAVKVAVEFINGSPTFKFDGVQGSMNATSVTIAETFAPPSFYIVNIEFDCSQGGYGDRTGQRVIQVVQHHTAVIHVTEGVVTLAVLDGVWDELVGVML
jgi:hypothetical protein